MCGRYALSLRPSEVRQRLQESHMPCDEAPSDDDSRIRQSYNFAPGYHGLVYRADVPDTGAGKQKGKDDGEQKETEQESEETAVKMEGEESKETHYKLQAMKWGLIPFWTKRNPDYGSMLKTINCRDDSLIENRGMWTTMKMKKRCIIVCEGFYEWLKKNNGKERIPHFVKRKDGQLMCFAGLWDCVKYEDSDEKHYTYTIITTDVNKQLKFLHDRMPVIFDGGSEAVRTWLDPNRTEWTKELQSLLKPYEGELECYPVSKDVGKVGNNSPSFIVPLNSAQNKSNIANFFGNQAKIARSQEVKKEAEEKKEEVSCDKVKIEPDLDEDRDTTGAVESTENHAPLPVPCKGIKREHSDVEDASGGLDADTATAEPPKKVKRETKSPSPAPRKAESRSSPPKKPAKQTRSATSNGTAPAKSPAKGGSQLITSFFNKPSG